MANAGQNLKLQQKQQMRLNLQQMMLGRLLEMSAPEFEEEIVRALEENPALSTMEDSGDGERVDVGVDDDYADDYDGDDLPSAASLPRTSYSGQPSAPVSEAETIERQLADMHLTDLEREVARYIIGNLDSSGYLTREVSAIADDMALAEGVDVETGMVERMVKAVQSLDPAGIAARDLRECLLIQLERMPGNADVRLATEIIKDRYNYFIKNRFEDLAESLGVAPERLEAAMKLIRSLNPKPGAALFDHFDNRTRHITPDFIVEEDEEGRQSVTLAGRIPELCISPAFVGGTIHGLDKKAEEFIRERRENANDFMEAVRRRSSTLMTIMRAIMTLQPKFFKTYESRHLRPMVIRDVERITGFDKSVISRATADKYMLTPEGMYSLKSLFSERASSDGDVSAREIEAIIRAIIDEEDKTHPLSDDQLTAAIKAKGHAVARRTIAKYRERLGIPVARLRRR